MPGTQDLRAKLVEALTRMIDDCEDFLCEKAHACGEFDKVLDAKKKELPVLAVEEGSTGRLAKMRLAGKDIDTPEQWKECLREVDFDDIEEAEAFARHDGRLLSIAAIAKELGDEALDAKARALLYAEEFDA